MATNVKLDLKIAMAGWGRAIARGRRTGGFGRIGAANETWEAVLIAAGVDPREAQPDNWWAPIMRGFDEFCRSSPGWTVEDGGDYLEILMGRYLDSIEIKNVVIA